MLRNTQQKKKRNVYDPSFLEEYGGAIVWTIVFIALGLGMWTVVSIGNHKIHTNPENKIKQQMWTEWNQFKDTHCKPSGKAYGIAVQAGKFTTHDNMDSWKCDDGIEYSINNNIYSRVQQCFDDSECMNLSYRDIPIPSTSERIKPGK